MFFFLSKSYKLAHIMKWSSSAWSEELSILKKVRALRKIQITCKFL